MARFCANRVRGFRTTPFGGWSDWQTFEAHYMGEMTPEARDRERAKIDYLGGEPEPDTQPMQPQTPATRQTYSGD